MHGSMGTSHLGELQRVSCDTLQTFGLKSRNQDVQNKLFYVAHNVKMFNSPCLDVRTLLDSNVSSMVGLASSNAA